ncbi:MAG: ThaI family type II restriction endonuclease, partial [Planctomycetaceae bacterium]|nr:ThaI family type II restriction endonuclease [Planctomycetaceae bacterium]
SKEIQTKTLELIGREKYMKLPKQGTNPRGVEIDDEAMKQLIENSDTLKIPIDWKKETINFKPFERWVELWQKD